MAQHRAAHGPGAPASDIVLVFHFAPFAAAVLAAALEREGAQLPPVRVADSCLLAKYAQSQLQEQRLRRDELLGVIDDEGGGGGDDAGASGSGAGAGPPAGSLSSPSLTAAADGAAAAGSPARPSRPHLRHDARLDALVAKFAPAWLTVAPWYRKTDALSDARSALLVTQALSAAAWGEAGAWRAFALGQSCGLVDVLGRAGYPDAAALVAGWREGGQ